MLQVIEGMNLTAIRNLFLQEVREYFAALGNEPSEELKIRMERIKLIEAVLEEKKKEAKSKDFTIYPNSF